MDAGGVDVWGGVECTVARVGDRIVDQVRRSGHHDRVTDLDRIADLGIRTLRYPVLWERASDWAWSDERLARLRELGIKPIVTLLHHGSGPRGTHLLDPRFPERFAEYAGAVARRYPWLRMFTPVNEPLTTARFSALYGHWYPHAADERSFATALLHQTEATARAMNAIRRHIPDALLVQTEDLGFTHSTPELAYQAQFENERRWASLDILCGRFGENPLYDRFRAVCENADAQRLMRSYMPPDILGFNYYITSERMIDDRVERYPGFQVGGNGRDRYVDVEASRVDGVETLGLGTLLSQAWERYERPIAVTEAHLGAGYEDQVRWLEELYSETCAARASGVDARGFTVWSLFGAYDWNSLLTVHEDFYESGCFDVSSGLPRETPVARWIRARAAGERCDDPCLREPGWWRRDDRYFRPRESQAS